MAILEVGGSKEAGEAATVTLWWGSNEWARAIQQGRYWYGEAQVNNATGSVRVVITNLGVVLSQPDRLQSETRSAFVAQTPELLIHDLDGNLVRDGRWMYYWDAENRLTRVMSYGATDRGSWRRVEWEYDSWGRRTRQTSYVYTNGVWQVVEDLKFVSDPELFGRHIAELNATNNALVRAYVWGLDLSETLDGAGGVGGLLWVRVAGGPAAGTHFVCHDGNGNVWSLASASTGTETARYEYGPFGEALRLSGPPAKANPFRFSTKRTEDFSGLVVYEYRAYSPTLGRWLSRDPVGELGGENLYVYVANDGVSASDSVGLCAAWLRAASAVALPGLKNPLPDIHKDLCTWLEGKIRSFLSSREDIRAWNRFVSGIGIDIELTESEMGSALVAAPASQAELKKQAEDCKANPFYWFNRTTQLGDTIGPPWSASLGRVTITLTTSCACRTLTWEACIFDKYDFDPTWFLGGREVTAEIKTILVCAADKVSQCGWKAFHHKGCKSGFVAN